MIKIYRVFLFGLVLFIVSFFINNNAIYALESINSFYSRIEINQDTSLSITEQIDYSTTLSKHGIYRYIPISYNKNGVKEVLPISNISVSDDKGFPIPFTRSSDGKFVNIKIGDPDVTFSGQKIYVISYKVDRGLFQFDDKNQLVWDITGEGWQIPILKSSATIISRHSPISSVNCYSGPVGGDDGLCNFEAGENQVTFSYLNQISYGDNMTVELNLPKQSQLIFPTSQDLFMMWLQNNWILFLIPVMPIIMFIWWLKKGRDIEFISQNVFDMDPNKPTKYSSSFFFARKPMVYEPLKDLSPGEAGSLIDGKTDIQDIVAEILELARKKYLKINVTEKKILFVTSRDYEFSKQTIGTEHINKVQEYLLSEIFKYGEVIKLSELKGKFYKSIPQIKLLIESSLMDKNIYTNKPSKVVGFGWLAVFVSSGLLFIIYSNTLADLGIVWPVFAIFFQAFVSILIASKLSQKTAVGTNLWLQSRGLKETIKRGVWREKINEKNLFIENVLPFSVALGVVKQLSKDMEQLNIKPPEYISSSTVNALVMSDFINTFNKDVATGLAYNPSSSSMSGGGSSGGGGGGGGGGSW